MPLRVGGYPEHNPDAQRSGSQPRPTRFTGDRMLFHADTAAALATGVMTSVAVVLEQGDVVTNIAFRVGATAADTPLNAWVALYSSAATPAKLAQSADSTTAAIAADAWYDKALSAPYSITATGVYYVAMMVKATAVPSLITTAAGNAKVIGGVGDMASPAVSQKPLSMSSGSALTGTAPATIATPTNLTVIPYACAH